MRKALVQRCGSLFHRWMYAGEWGRILVREPPASVDKADFVAQLKATDTVMSALGVPPNDKGQGPDTRAVFSGILIDTVAGIKDIDEEQRLYLIQRLEDILGSDSASPKVFASVNGSLGWVCYVIPHGRPRRWEWPPIYVQKPS